MADLALDYADVMTPNQEHSLFDIYSYPHGKIPHNWVIISVCLFYEPYDRV